MFEFELLYFVWAYGVGMIILLIGSELSLRRIFSNPNIIDLDISLSGTNFFERLDFVYVDIGDLDG